MTAIDIAGLHRYHPGKPPVHALRGIDLHVPDGAIVAILGPSGCGKTTLLRIIAGLDRADAGEVRLGTAVVEGRSVHTAPRDRSVGLLPQEGALFPHLDVTRNIGFGLQHLRRPERRARVEELLEVVGLTDLARRRPHQLSGGQQQRVALARALAPDPGVVLLDEPFSALDTGLRSALRDEVAALLRSSGTTAVLVTHDQAEAMAMADTVAVMREGAIVQVGTPQDVYHRPVDPWIGRFVGDAIVLRGHLIDTHQATCLLGTVQVARTIAGDDAELDLFFRPEQFLLRPPGAAAGALATVCSVSFEGPIVTVELDLAGTTIRARRSSATRVEVGSTVAVEVEGSALGFAPS